MVKKTNNKENGTSSNSHTLTFEENNSGGTLMKKQIHIQVNGFDIYLGVSKNTAHQEQVLVKAYEKQQLEREIEMIATKAEYDMRRLSA